MKLTPGTLNAPKLWPALPWKVTFMVPSGRPRSPWQRAMTPAMVAPAVRSVLLIGSDLTYCMVVATLLWPSMSLAWKVPML